MPSLDDSIALQLDAIERHHRAGKALTHPEVMFLVSTLRREMATTQALRGRLEHICQAIEKAHAASAGMGSTKEDGK